MLLAAVVAIAALAPVPAEGTPPRRVRCGTGALLRPALPAGATLGLTDRPRLPDVLDSAARPLRVHFDPATTAPAAAALVLAAAEEAWTQQVDGAGFPPPLSDDAGFDDDGGDPRLDIYLGPIAPGVGALTVSGADIAGEGPVVRAAFVRIAPAIDDDGLAVATHHEFQHVVQFAVDARESPLWFEATATAWEQLARPDVDDWQEALPSFQRQPQAPLTTDASAFAPFATDDGGLYEYGAALWALHLETTLGTGDGALLRALWTSSAQPRVEGPATADANEPDWLDGLAGQVGGDDALRALLLDFAGWRALTGPRAVADDGPPRAWALDGRATLAASALRLDALSGVERTTTIAEGPFPLGCATFAGVAPADRDVPLRIEATSVAGHPVAVVAVVRGDHDGDGTASATREQSPVDVAVTFDVDVPATYGVVVAVCDLALVDADRAPEFSPVRLRLARRDAPVDEEGEGEGEGDNDDDPPTVDGVCGDDAVAVDCGCACQEVPSAPGSPSSMRQAIGTAGFVVGGVALLLRGWRTWRRRRLYRVRRE